MNPSTAEATVLIDALIRGGVRDAVLSPGSRSAPLAFALAVAERAGRLRLHVRIDERSAGFLALGLAKASGLPVPVVVTSGTAVANLHPAVVEASFAGVPLVVLSADRPGVLRGTGAPQTVDQIKMFGGDVRSFVEMAQARNEPGQVAYWRSSIARALARATDPADPGPIHLNLPFAEPLVPDPDTDDPFAEPLAGRGDDAPWVSPFAATPADVALTDLLDALGFDEIPERGLVVVGDLPDVGWDGGPKAAYLAAACGWPIIAEPSSGMHRAPTFMASGSLLAGSAEWIGRHVPELVISIGRVGLTRQVSRLLSAARVHVAIDRTQRWADPTRSAAAVLIGGIPEPPQLPTDAVGRHVAGEERSWLAQWRAADDAVLETRRGVLEESAAKALNGLHVADALWRSMPDEALLFLGSSWPVRQAYLTALPRTGLRVLSNRGANGIDGVVSSAWGAAVAHRSDIGGPSFALIGDLTFLHDSNGLIVPVEEDRPELTFVVIDNRGGGIFSQLEQAAPAYSRDFERVFGTSHTLNLTGLARLLGAPSRNVTTAAELADALAVRPDGVSVIVASVAPRAAEAALLARLQRRAAGAIARFGSARRS